MTFLAMAVFLKRPTYLELISHGLYPEAAYLCGTFLLLSVHQILPEARVWLLRRNNLSLNDILYPLPGFLLLSVLGFLLQLSWPYLDEFADFIHRVHLPLSLFYWSRTFNVSVASSSKFRPPFLSLSLSLTHTHISRHPNQILFSLHS